MLSRFRDRWLRGCVAVFLASTQACYTFLPVAAGIRPRVGEQAQIYLTPEGTSELARYLGPNVTAAEGAVAAVAEDGTITVAVDMIEQSNGLRQPWTGEGVVAIPAMYQREVRERTFQKRRSVVAGTLLGLGLVTLAIVALRAATGGDGGVEVPPPPP